MKKRIIALLLALVMVVGMLPTGMAVEANNDKGFTYNFMRLQWGEWSDEGIAPKEASDWSWLETVENFHKRETDPYMYYGQSEDASWTWEKSSANQPEFGPNFTGVTGDWVAYVVRVGTNGIFQPVLVHANRDDGGDFNVYLAPIGAENPRAPEYKIGTFNTYNKAIQYQKIEEFGKVALSEGDYVFSMEVDEGYDGGSVQYVSRFLLKTASGSWIDANVDDVEVEMFDTVNTTPTFSLDGTPLAGADLDTLRVVSTDPSVATAEIVDNGGEPAIAVTGVYLGETTLNVYAEKDGAKGAVTVPVNVEWKTGYNLTEAIAPNAPTEIELEKPTTFAVGVKFNGIPVSFDDAESISVTSSDSCIVSSYEVDGEDLNITLTGKFVGTSDIKVSVVYNGFKGEVVLPVTVLSHVFKYNFMKVWYGPWSDSAYDPNTFTSFGKTTAGHEDEMNPSVFSDPWLYHSVTGDGKVEWNKSAITYGMPIDGGVGSEVRFQIRLPESGVYTAISNHSYGPTYQAAEIFLAPVEAKNPTAPWYSVGTMETFANVVRTFLDQELGQAVLPAGDYWLIYKHVENPKSSNQWMPVAEFKLRTEKVLRTTLHHDIDEAIVMRGGETSFNLTAKLDGADYELTNFPKINIETSDASVATAEIDLASGKMTVYGHKLGNVIFTLTGTDNDGNDTILNIPYEVVAEDTFYRVEVIGEKNVLGVGDTVQLTAKAYRIDGQEIPADETVVYFESNKTATAMVSSDGLVTGRNGGTATISAYIMVNATKATRIGTFDVTVDGYQPLASVELVVPPMIEIGSRVDLAVKARLADGTAVNMATAEIEELTYNIVGGTAAGSARIMNGTQIRVTKNRGTVELTATLKLKGGEAVTSPVVTIRATKSGDPAPFSKLVLSSDRTRLSVGETATLKAGGQLTDGTYKYYTAMFKHESEKGSTISFVNSAEDVISIDANGKITALKEGSADLTLTANVGGVDYEKTLKIVVDDGTLDSLGLSLAKSTVLLDERVKIAVVGQLTNGRYTKEEDLTIAYASDNASVASVMGGYLDANGVGTATITVTASLNSVTVEETLTVTVEPDSIETVTATASAITIKPNAEGTQINFTAKTRSGASINVKDCTAEYTSLTPEVASVSDEGFVTPLALGDAEILVTVTHDGVSKTATVKIKVKDGKTTSTYMTAEKVAAARENIKNFDWAAKQATTAQSNAEYYIVDADWAWDLIPGQDIPRAIHNAGRFDPETAVCRYCGDNLAATVGNNYPFLIDVKNNPWKIQCPTCRRRFPSNDFEAFYKAGINDHGFFDYEYAKQTASHLLVNEDFPEKDEYIDKNGVVHNEGIHGWGVDDSRGYVTDEDYELSLGYGTTKRVQTYIAYYAHWGLWHSGFISNAVSWLASSYVYTGDKKYGRIAAIMIDRIADVYPDMYVSEYFPIMSNSDFNTARGRLVGGIWDTNRSASFVQYYDYVYDVYDDPWVVDFLHNKAVQYNLGDPRGEHGTEYEGRGGVGNDKSTPELIRQNIENGLVREVIDAVINENEIYGNQGMHQSTVAMAAVVLDNMPETSDSLDWVLGGGGKVLSDLVGTLNRDGQGVEAAPGYSDTWVSSYLGIVDALEPYEGYAAANLYDNVKFVKLIKTNFPLTLTRSGTASIGDSGAVAHTGFDMSMGRLVTAFTKTGDPEIAQYIYFLNGNKVDGIEGNIFTPAKTVAADIQAVIDEYGEYPFDESSAMTGSFGFFGLRDGQYKRDLNKTIDTQRDFWMYFGRSTNHGHPGVLNLGIDAYGIAVSSEFGYPEVASDTPRTKNWDISTITHNVVQVDDKMQKEIANGQALHFDGDNDGRVQVMDARAPAVYAETSEYRRTNVMVDYDDEISYAVDFFRVTGGSSHTFSFQAMSQEFPKTENLNFVKQSMGTYAGPLVEHGNYALNSGYDGFYDVYRAASPGSTYSVDFKIMDWRKRLKNTRDVHLRVTQLNDFDVDEVALAKGQPPQVNTNPEYLNFMLVDRNGENLDSLFTTVLQPYDTKPYIIKEEDVSIVRSGGASEGATDVAKAVKLTMVNGREDYVIYATNNKVQYQIDGWLEFKGFVGVLSVENDEITYRYVHDGTLIADTVATPSYTGNVVDFTKDLSFDNYITVKFNTDVDLDRLIGNYFFVNSKNSSYKIFDAVKNEDGTVTFDIGDYSLCKSVKDASKPTTGGYNYEIAVGNNVEIPLTTVEDDTPVWEEIPNKNANVGVMLKVPFKAETPSGAPITYTLANDTANVALDAENQIVYFNPTTAQIGVNTIGIRATNKTLSSVTYFEVEVSPSTASNAGTGGGGGGGGGGGSAEPEEPKPEAPKYEDLGDNLYKDEDGNIINAGADKTPGTADDKKVEETPVEEGFIDLGNHAWAVDAIDRLVEQGIIKGVSANKFAPANQITRADFAILLVRAWEMDSEEKGEFADVSAADYFANEVAIASGLGIVKGLGEDKFAPRASITREQMMVMLYRTLTAVEAEIEAAEADVLAQFADADKVSDYAVEAVATMVANGYIQGANGNINPQGSATRAEVAVLLDRILNQ